MYTVAWSAAILVALSLVVILGLWFVNAFSIEQVQSLRTRLGNVALYLLLGRSCLYIALYLHWRRFIGFFGVRAGWTLSTLRRAYRQRDTALITAIMIELVLIQGSRVII